MNCQNHPNKESVATCIVCGKSICEECRLLIGDKDYCQECVTEIVATEAPKKIKQEETSKDNSNKSIEEKYEKYLDDLYEEDNIANDENDPEKISLKDQLARDEAKYGAIIKKPRKPTEPTHTQETPENHDDKSSLKSIKSNNENKKNRQSLHPHIHSGQKKKKVEEESTSTEIALTFILIAMITIVSSYIIYLFTLAGSYPNFFDAIFTLFSDPAEIINHIFT